MKVEYLPSFIKDLKALRGTSAYEPIRALVFEVVPEYQSLQEFQQIKKLKNADSGLPHSSRKLSNRLCI